MGRELIDEIITLIKSESNDNPAPKPCKIIKNYDDEPYCDVEVEELGTLVHKKTIGSTNLGLEGVVCFLNGDLNQSIVITESILEIDFSPIYNELDEISSSITDLDNNKSDINHLHSQYLTEHQDLSNYAVKNDVNQSLNTKVNSDELFDLIYPVGSIYMSVNNVNPSNLFGGTWEQIKDKFLLANGDSYSLGSTGGEATHTLTKDEIPAHTHTQNAHSHTPATNRNFLTAPVGSTWAELQGANISGSGYHYIATSKTSNYDVAVQASGSTTATNQNTGGGKSHNNMPPYLAVNIWKRVG